jgi:hypothetical protein
MSSSIAAGDNDDKRGKELAMRKLIATMLLLGAALATAWVYVVSDEKRFEALSRAVDAILDRVPAVQ